MEKDTKAENTQKIFISGFPSFQIPYFPNLLADFPVPYFPKKLIFDKEELIFDKE